MRKKNRTRILGIDPGTRNIGFALFDGGDLVHYGVKTIQAKNSPHETLKAGRRIILRLISDFSPDSLVVEKTFFAKSRNAALLNVFGDEIKALGKRRGLQVQSFAANTVRKIICGNGAASKDDVAKAMVSHYPELKPYLTSDRKWKERYQRNMFDAVALAMVAGRFGK
ncbi:MAG: crossover junction endodeoxyribonuclease RuvC [Bacteroidota bacterium]